MQCFNFLAICLFALTTTCGQEHETEGRQLDINNQSKYQNKTGQNDVKVGPYFIYPSYANIFNKLKYFGGVPDCEDVAGITVLQVKANDSDSAKAGMIEYSFVNSKKWARYFAINSLSGVIKTLSTLSNISAELPIIVDVQAQDGPNNGSENLATTQVVINKISDEDQVLLLLCCLYPEEVLNHDSTIVTVIEETTNLIVNVENVTAPSDNLMHNHSVTTAMWVYFIDPINETVLPRNNYKIQKNVLSKEALQNLTKVLSNKIPDITNVLTTTSSLESPISCPSDKPIELVIVIIIAVLIALLSCVFITYLCISWSRYKASKEHMVKAYSTPWLNPVLFVEPTHKEYETQGLQMDVPLNDSDSSSDFQLDLRNKNHKFNLDSVSYITKDRRNGGSTSSSEVSSVPRTSSRSRQKNNSNMNGNINHSYDRSEEDLGPGSASRTNENVTFREKKDYSHMGFNYLKNRPEDSITIL